MWFQRTRFDSTLHAAGPIRVLGWTGHYVMNSVSSFRKEIRQRATRIYYRQRWTFCTSLFTSRPRDRYHIVAFVRAVYKKVRLFLDNDGGNTQQCQCTCFPAGRLCGRISLLFDYQEFMLSHTRFLISEIRTVSRGGGAVRSRAGVISSTEVLVRRSCCARIQNTVPRTNRFGFWSCRLTTCYPFDENEMDGKSVVFFFFWQ
jgi:hypothetical protein